MTGPSLDLDALREWAELGARNPGCEYMEYRRLTSPTRVLAVLSLVDEQRKEIERLREALQDEREKWSFDTCMFIAGRLLDEHYPVNVFTGDGRWGPGEKLVAALRECRDALAGSPAEKEQP